MKILFSLAAAFLCLISPLVVTAEGQTRVDVLIVYTPAVTEHYNGHDGVLAHMLAMVAGTNAALENSEASMFFHLVHSAEVNYVEAASMNDDLTRLRSPSDGYMDEVHALRDQWGADLVCLVRRGSAGGTAGLAYLLTDTSGSPTWAFSVVADAGAVSNFVFAHELGHNLGAGHAHGDLSSSGIFAYSHGHRFYGQDAIQYRTIMAYLPGIRIPHFSNPLVSYEGTPTGVPSWQTNPADVVLTLDDTGPVVAGYRAEQGSVPQILREPQDVTIAEGRNLILHALVNGVPPLDLQWFEGEAGDTSQPVAGATEAVLRIGPLFSTSRYWLRVTNAQGTVASRAATVAVVPSPVPPNLETVEQATLHNGFPIDRETWQVAYSPFGYWHTLALRLWKKGSPGPVKAEILNPGGFVLFEHTIQPSSVSGSANWITFPVGIFLPPGEPLRIQLTPLGFFSDDDFVIWDGADGAYPEGSSSVDPFFPGYAFTFRAIGTQAWTYHTWAVVEDLDGNSADPTSSPMPGGLPNLLRYVLNVDSISGDGAMPFVAAPTTGGGGEYIPFEFRQRKAIVDAAVTVESSDDLVQWEVVSAAYIFPLPDDDAETARFEARVPLSPEQKSMFLRLDVSLPQPE